MLSNLATLRGGWDIRGRLRRLYTRATAAFTQIATGSVAGGILMGFVLSSALGAAEAAPPPAPAGDPMLPRVLGTDVLRLAPATKAVDISHWSGELSPRTVEAWKAAGVRRVIVGVAHKDPAMTRRQLEAVIAAGIKPEVYLYLYQDKPVAWYLDVAAEATRGLSVGPVFWLDFEDDAVGGPVVDWIGDAVNQARARGWQPGIYTRLTWWVPHTGNTDRFRDLPLWDAHYREDDIEEPLPFVPYGGWAAPMMSQYKGTTELAGYSVDKNWRKGEVLPPPKAEKPLDNAEKTVSRLGILPVAKALGR